jgi:Na+-transporting methylmalonyl-CoA/oxaloacetate decarboxylase gamma subunit
MLWNELGAQVVHMGMGFIIAVVALLAVMAYLFAAEARPGFPGSIFRDEKR